MSKTDENMTDADFEPMTDEEMIDEREPRRFRARRLIRWVLVIGLGTVAILAILTIMTEQRI